MDATQAVWSTALIFLMVFGLGAVSWWTADRTIDGTKQVAAWAKTQPDRVSGWVKGLPDQTVKSYEDWTKAHQGQGLQILADALVGAARFAATVTEPLRAWAERERPSKAAKETVADPSAPPELPAPKDPATPDWPDSPPGPDPVGSPFRPDPATPTAPEPGRGLNPPAIILPPQPTIPSSPPTSPLPPAPAAPSIPVLPAAPALPAAQQAGQTQPQPQEIGAVMTAIAKNTGVLRNIAAITGFSGVIAVLKELVKHLTEDVATGNTRLTASMHGLHEDAELDNRIAEMVQAFNAIQRAFANNQLEAAASVPIQQAAIALQGAMVAHRNAHAAQVTAIQLRSTAQRRLMAALQQIVAAQTYMRRVHLPKAQVEASTGARSSRDFSTN